MAKRAYRRWNDLRVSPFGRTVKQRSDLDANERRRRIAIHQNQPAGADAAASKRYRNSRSWTWKLSYIDGECGDCSAEIPEGAKYAWIHPAKIALCVACACRTGVAAKCKPDKDVRALQRREESEARRNA